MQEKTREFQMQLLYYFLKRETKAIIITIFVFVTNTQFLHFGSIWREWDTEPAEGFMTVLVMEIEIE